MTRISYDSPVLYQLSGLNQVTQECSRGYTQALFLLLSLSLLEGWYVVFSQGSIRQLLLVIEENVNYYAESELSTPFTMAMAAN